MKRPQRKQLRLERYDYAQAGMYFITICTHGCVPLFGTVVGNGLDRSAVALSRAGELAKQGLLEMPTHFPCVAVVNFVVMPNHIHTILALGCQGEAERASPFSTVSTIVGLYKSGVSRQIHQVQPGVRVWQTSFHDHIIRSQTSFETIWQYIETNPQKWALDRYYRQG